MADSSALEAFLSQIPYQQPPPGVTSNLVDPPTLTTVIISVSAVSSAIALVFLAIRLWSTAFITRSVGSDDFMAVAAFASGLGVSALAISVRDLSRHAWDLPLSLYTPRVSKIVFSLQIVVALGLFFSKMAILILLYRIFSLHKGFRYAVYFGMVWALAISLTTILVDCVLCTPRPGAPFGSITTALRCTDLRYWVAVSGVVIMLLDFYIFFLPMPMVWRLQMATRKKLGVILIFMTGLIGCVASILSLYYKILFLRNTDPLYNSFKVEIVTLVEINVAVVVASMPACSSFYRRYSPQITIFSSLRSRFTKSRSDNSNSNSNTQNSSSNTTLQGDAMEMRGSKGLESGSGERPPGKYWRLKNVMGGGGILGKAPQITVNRNQSEILRTKDFDFGLESRGGEGEGWGVRGHDAV